MGPEAYNRNKMLASVLYVLNGAGASKTLDFHSVHKRFYVADKYSLANFGRTISGNTYIRMEYGPVASELDYLLDALREQAAMTSYFGKPTSTYLSVSNRHFVEALVDTPMRYLSEVDIGALDHGIAMVKNLNFSQRSILTHDSAWDSARSDGRPIAFEQIVIASGGGEDALDYIKDSSDS